MAEEVKLPQLGESVTEGTITAWLVEEGEEVEEDQPLFEISTDKIDTEVPSPASGVLQEIRAQVDDTVEVGEVVAVIGSGDGAAEADEEADEDAGEDTDEDADEDADEDTDEDAAEEEDDDAAASEDQAETEEAADQEEREQAAADEVDEEEETGEEAPSGEEEPTEEEEDGGRVRGDDTDGEAALMSPIVRRMVRDNDLDPSRIEGSGKGGRITREDVERAIEEGSAAREEEPAQREAAAATAAPERPAARKPHENVRGRKDKLPRVRAAIAKHMWNSLHTTAQLTAAREVDVTKIMDVRARAKDDFREREGVGLSPLPFFARAVCMVLPQHEALNASIDVDAGEVKYYETINLGMAVDAPQGLIVPNIKDAQDLTVPALAKRIADVADRVRNRKITPDDVQGGTFTITNTGSRGVLFDTPVLNPPETGILATPAIEKRPVVVEQDGSDAIAIRYMTYLCLTYDHRMVDGADAARFLGDLKEIVETHDWGTEVGA